MPLDALPVKTQKTDPLPVRSLEAVIATYPYYRQSLLGNVDNCALSAKYELEGFSFTNAAQARGIIFHRYAAEWARTLWRTGEKQMPHEEAIQILYEVSRQENVPSEDVVIVPARERRYLRMAALSLADVQVNMKRLLSVEKRLFATVSYPFGGTTIERQISGQTDAVLLGGSRDELVVLDWKTAPSAPAKGEQPHWTGDHLHVSYEGYWQQRFYALLLMADDPQIQTVTLREYYPIPREAREARVPREALEHIEQEIGVVVQFLDRALQEGGDSPIWGPSPGRHCSYCRRPADCPIERRARAAQGGITSAEQAREIGAEAVLSQEVYKESREALKNWHEVTGEPIPVASAKGRYEWRWSTNSKGGRSFGLFIPEESDRGPVDAELDAAFEAAAVSKGIW